LTHVLQLQTYHQTITETRIRQSSTVLTRYLTYVLLTP